MNLRKVIQIAVCVESNQDGEAATEIVALCDDNTIWYLPYRGKGSEWHKLPPVPDYGDGN